MSNIYHLLSFLPAVERWEMPPALERLAEQLVASGKLRINADAERNFVRHGTADSDKTFTARELTDPALLPVTRRELARHVARAAGPDAVEALLTRLLGELKKARGVDVAKEMKVARCVVQAAHPSVIMLLIQSGTELFVSYAHSVGDLLAVHEWQTHGTTNGMQATSQEGTAVYLSCGGDPFFQGEHKTYLTDGFPALARMLVIGGQELGHFADLLRTKQGIVGRYSTDIHASLLRPAPVVRAARMSDMVTVATIKKHVDTTGLPALRRAENAAAFYGKRLRFSPPWFVCQFWRGVMRLLFLLRTHPRLLLRTHPRYMHGEALSLFLADMAFNLAPDADAYRHPDPDAEEAIACIEALARVPQQVHKWGHRNVAIAWPQLYAVYFGTVIPGCIAAAGGTAPGEKPGFLQEIFIFVRRLARTRPGYYP